MRTFGNIYSNGGNMGDPPSPKFDQNKFIGYLAEKGITDPYKIAIVLGHLKAESGLVPRSESLKYSAEEIYRLFPKKFTSIEDARAVVAEGEEALGNRVYGSRMKNKADEGYKFRGRGYIQLTGRGNYEKYGKRLGLDLVSNPDLANDPEVAMQIAAEFLADKNINKLSYDGIARAIGYRQTDEENARRKIIIDSYMKDLGVSGKSWNIPINPTQSAPTVTYKEDLDKFEKSLKEYYNNEILATDKELYPDHNNAKVKPKENPNIVDDLYIKPSQNVNFGNLPKFQY